MSQLNVDTIKKADGTGNLSVPANTGTLVDTSGATFTGAIAMGANNISFSNGNGIDFSASEGSGASSSVLNDYEEGTFTPTIAGDSGTENLRSGNATLSYTKIGNLVHVRGKLETISAGGATGGLKITSLPFATGSGTDTSELTATWVLLRDYGSTLNQVFLATFDNSTEAFLYHVDNSGNLSGVDGSEVDTAFELWLSMTYYTDA